MRALSARDVLGIVERDSGSGPTSAALGILACAAVDEPAGDLARLPIGVRDRLLLDVRRRSLGSALIARERCPRCATELELTLDAAELLVGEAPALTTGLAMRHGELELRFRLPNSEDLLCVEGCADADSAARALAARCIESALRAGREIAATDVAADLDADELEALGRAIAEADPQADRTLDLRCAECGHRFERELDPAGFFLEELAGVARRLFAEIHVLARGYGWSEADILAMSAWRRRAYVEMLAP